MRPFTVIFSVVGFGILPAATGWAGAVDPGVRQAGTDNGSPPQLQGLTADEQAFFQDGLARFSSVKVVLSPTGDNSGLGPRFNSNACSSCHLQPFIGGTSPAVNPLPAVASAAAARNDVPWFIVSNRPIREARFIASNGAPDGGVHDLFVVTGRNDVSASCNIAQPVFLPAGNGLTGQGGNPNIIFRIPTPVLGAGLIEAIPDSAILANMRTNTTGKHRTGVWDIQMRTWAAIPIAARMTALSRASAGRPRTSPCRYSRARPITSKWASRTCSLPRSVTRPRHAREET